MERCTRVRQIVFLIGQCQSQRNFIMASVDDMYKGLSRDRLVSLLTTNRHNLLCIENDVSYRFIFSPAAAGHAPQGVRETPTVAELEAFFRLHITFTKGRNHHRRQCWPRS